MQQLEVGDVIFVKKKRHATFIDRIVQKLVCWATGSEYFHVAYFVAGDVVFESNSFRKAGYASLEDYADYSVKRLNYQYIVRYDVLQKILSTKGAGYGWGEVLALLLRKKFGIQIYFDSPSRYICSGELASAMFKLYGIRIVDQPTDDISPQDLWDSPYLSEVKLLAEHL